ncbi:MAG: hypothetical protein ABI577_09030 [bacterium]
MTTRTESPLAMLVQQGLESVGACPVDPALRRPADTPSETVEQLAAGLLVAMGLGEISSDLDLQAVALLGAACVAGLQAFGEMEPGIHRLDQAIFALEDLLRRTSPARAN